MAAMLTQDHMAADAAIITQAQAGEIDLIMPVMASSFDPRYGEAWTLPQCAGMLSLPGAWLLIARSNTHVIGFALSRIIIDEAELLLLAVDKAQQRSGLGSALLTHMIADAQSRGAARIHLEVRSNNGAQIFYTNHGFVACGERKNYYRGSEGQLTNAITLVRHI